jgi:phosphohistidine swiveling domain-containing protein
LVLRDKNKTDYYLDDKQHKKYIVGLYKLLKNKKFIKNFHQAAQLVLENILANTKRVLGQDLSLLTNKQLLSLYTNFILPNLEQFYIRMWTVFNIGEPLAELVSQKLFLILQDRARADKYLLKLSSPLVPNDVLNERLDSLRLAIKKPKVSAKNFRELLKKHCDKYRHIPMFDFDHLPYTYQYFYQEIKKIKKPAKELQEIKKLFASRRREFKDIVSVLKADRNFKNLLYFLKENVFLRDYRDMIRQKYNLELRKFYMAVGQRLSLNIDEVAILTNREIIKYLKSGKKFPHSIIRQRKSAFLLKQENGAVEIFSGNEALRQAKQELNFTAKFKDQKIEGVTGASGKARGRVVLVFTNRELSKVKAGDVLVTTMTRQDFVPAIRKSAALVTDEGSVTCHAAIIARELGIPCIVRTKIGTSVLKDGDRVEVDADKGIISRISGTKRRR